MSLSGDWSLTSANPDENYFSYNPRKDHEGEVPHPSKIISGSDHVFIVDSRDRNMNVYPSPSYYCMSFPDKFKNVTSIELKGSVIPKTEFNVNSENNKIAFNLQDFITNISIEERGRGYVDGVYTTPDVTVTAPAIAGGTQATVTVTVTNGRVTAAVITVAGTGYLRGYYGSSLQDPTNGFFRNAGASININIPKSDPINFVRAEIGIQVGNEIVAVLNQGQYDFANPNDSAVGLCREVTRALQVATQDAIDDGILALVGGGPTTGAEYWPYAAVNDASGSCWLWTPNVNASENTNVAIQRGTPSGPYLQDLFFELIWGESTVKDSNAVRVLGMGSSIPTSQGIPNTPLDKTSGETSALVAWSSAPVLGPNNYTITDFPKYLIMNIGVGPGDYVDRIDSVGTALDKGFATLVFDANAQDVIWRAPAATPVDGTGNSSYATLLSKPGTLKGIKGPDFDSKIINFGTSPIAELKTFCVGFYKTNGDPYDFHGEDHLLIFQVSARDINSGNRW